MSATEAVKGEKLLGIIQTKAVGLQYYDGGVTPGMQVILEREKDNVHDKNSVRVENAAFDPVGHLPRKTAAWLAPLLDEGKIRIDGRVLSGEDQEHSAPIDLSIYLAPKGSPLLKKCRKPSSGPAALHQLVLSAYLQGEAWDNPQTLLDLSTLLEPLCRLPILPETRLLLELLPLLSRKSGQEPANRQSAGLVQALRSVKLGDRVHYRNLTVFPLYQTNGHEPGYLLLSEALEQDLAEVTEVSSSGTVPTLQLINRAPKPILIPEGEIVVGGKQNRTINITILVQAGQTFMLPVSCVEQGRWHRLSDRFNSRFHAPPILRANKMRSVRANRAHGGGFESDQGQVWADVECYMQEACVSSETSNLTDGYEQAADQINVYRDHLPIPAAASGVMVLHGQQVIGMDLFDHHHTLEYLWPRLSEAYILAFAGKAEAEAAEDSQAQAFLASLAENVKPAPQQLGLGLAYDIEGPEVIGSALWYEGRACHVAAFPDAGERDRKRAKVL